LVPHSDPGFFATMTQAEFSLKNKTENSITFSAEPMKGFIIEKSYNWVDGGIGRIVITTENRTRKTIEIPEWSLHLGPGIGTVPSEKEENPKLWQASYAVTQADRKLPVTKNLAKETPDTDWLWAGVHNRYFLAAAMPENWPYKKLVYEPKITGKEKVPGLSAPVEKTLLAPGAKQEWSLNFYIGPKNYRHLMTLGHGLDRSVDFGFFGPIGKAILKVLYFNHRLTGNYGWAIILLTIMVQILMSPLTYKSFKATMIMKQLQPKLQQIQTKHKGNSSRLNQEMLELYRKNGANPFSGCLPMVLQIPIFFALFTALRNSWDLHGAYFALWVTDLSAKDPYYVFPIVMGAVMFFQQKFTMAAPAGGDPAQMAVMKWMPVIFTFMFLSFPAGLVLYWMTSSIIGFGQQMYLQKRMTIAV
jgi:YidC/Oxa1 family membrane protein insertase